MKNISNIPNEDIKEVIALIHNACNEAKVDFYLIGARAKDFWLLANKIEPRRFTLDIDFAVLVPSLEVFEKIKEILSKKYGFKTIEKTPHRIIFIKYDLIIDILPFGGVEKAGYINFNDKFDTKISILGFQEVYENSVTANISGEEIKVATLPGLCILKLIAWSDKPFERENDIKDISNIIQHFFDIESEIIYKEHLDLFENDDFDMVNAGAHVLGRQINKILSHSAKAKKRIIEILESNVQNVENSKIGTIIAKDSGITIEKAVHIINEILNGINDKL
jgi:predicted nucleotidyltransferase